MNDNINSKCYTILYIDKLSIEDIAYHKNFTVLIDLKVSVNEVIQKLNIKKPITIEEAKRILYYVNI